MVVEDCVGGSLPRPSRLSTPVTLTLTLSLHRFAMVSLNGIGDNSGGFWATVFLRVGPLCP